MTDDPQHDEQLRVLYDAGLADRVRTGDIAAFDELYRRHHAVARRTARWMMQSEHAADDVVADVFASMLAVFRNGRGPRDHFPAYLKAAVRNRCIAHRKASARSRPTEHDDLDRHLGPSGSTTEASATSQLVATAFAALNPRWQRTLWMSEVEGRPAADIAAELGLPAAAVPALAYRARRAFAEAYLRQHVEMAPDGACRAVADKLPRYVRESASHRDVQKVEAHLATCATCRRTVEEMSDLNLSLRTLPTPPAAAAAAAGVGGLAAWMATVAAIGAFIILPVVSLRSDAAADRAAASGREPATLVAEDASPVPIELATGDTDTVDASGATTPVTPATESSMTPTTTPPTESTIPPAATVAAAPTTAPGEPADVDDLTAPGVTGGAPSGVLPGIGTPPLDTALPPPLTIAVDLPLPAAPVDVDASVGAGGVGVDAGVGLPGGLGGIDAGVDVGGGGVQVTVVVPTLPIVGALPPVTVAITLPPVTLPPVTLPPVTLPPVTLPPVTLPPVTLPPLIGGLFGSLPAPP